MELSAVTSSPTGKLDTVTSKHRRNIYSFILGLFLLGAVVIGLKKPDFGGDALEYTLMTIAIAEHGSPDIRASDVAIAKELAPQFSGLLGEIENHMNGKGKLLPGFLVGKDNGIYSIHYFGYSALAAVPYKIAQLTGMAPLKCYLWVGWLSMMLLTYAALRYFGSMWKALAVSGVFLITVGLPYWNWISPEFFTATLALAALLFMGTSCFVVAGVLTGLAAGQNPPLLILLFLGPIMVLADHYVGLEKPAISTLLRQQKWRAIGVGTLIGCAIGLTPIYFSFKFFDTWNIIALIATDSRLVSAGRLFSYYFDLNQGMIIAIPGVLLLIFYAIARQPRLALVFILAAICSLILAIPSLSTHNWNSASSGMMRYVVWGSVPILFMLFAGVRRHKKWPIACIPLFILVQGICLWHGGSYGYVEFSPVARWMLKHAPSYYNPVPEIFVERSTVSERPVDFDQSYSFEADGERKTLYHRDSLKGISTLCKSGFPHARSVSQATADGWTYLNGAIECDGRAIKSHAFAIDALERQEGGRLESGWSRFEPGAPESSGVWSIGKESRILLRMPHGSLDTITILGGYYPGNTKSVVTINGQEMGTLHLDRPTRIRLAPLGQPQTLEIVLRHQSPTQASATDTRQVAFFLRQLLVSYQIAP